MRLFFVFIFIFQCLNNNAQQFDANQFEDKLNRFYFGMTQNLVENDFKPDKVLYYKMAGFVNENTEDIKKYRGYIINRYYEPFINNSNFVIDDSTDFSEEMFNFDLVKKMYNEDDVVDSVFKITYEFLTINPVAVFWGIAQGDYIRTLSEKEDLTSSNISTVFSFSRPLIICTNKKNDGFTICIDYYIKRYFLDFNTTNSKFSNFKVYKRTKSD